MKVVGFKGREHSLKLTKYKTVNEDDRPRSKLHLRCRKLLREIFPVERIIEELKLPGSRTTHGLSRGSILYADFFLVSQKMVVEVHGRQHYEFVAHFHKDKRGFLESKVRDRHKREWCEMNNIPIVCLPYNETDKQWEKRIIDELSNRESKEV